ncbi:MAG: hypothetical protein EA357_00960 [Micavibrio sp.]|nr:MAG: hypothetical protein EA357_00960 [Micavibrio sp.]
MYQWLKILETIRLTGEKAEEDFKFSDWELGWGSDWEPLVMRFIAEVEVEAESESEPEPVLVVRVDFFPFFFELLEASLVVPTGKPIMVVIGEGWEMTGTPAEGGYNIDIGFELSEKREPVLSRQLSTHETMLFIAVKLSELVESLKALGVRVEDYFPHFPPEEYKTRYLGLGCDDI